MYKIKKAKFVKGEIVAEEEAIYDTEDIFEAMQIIKQKNKELTKENNYFFVLTGTKEQMEKALKNKKITIIKEGEIN